MMQLHHGDKSDIWHFSPQFVKSFCGCLSPPTFLNQNLSESKLVNPTLKIFVIIVPKCSLNPATSKIPVAVVLASTTGFQSVIAANCSCHHTCVFVTLNFLNKKSWEQKKGPTRCLGVPHYHTWVLTVCLADLKVSHIHAEHGCGFVLRAQVATSYLRAPCLDWVVRNFTCKVINFKYDEEEVDPCTCILSVWFATVRMIISLPGVVHQRNLRA